jgi:MoaA/NifB/PqqE/SkfB family radical SAM enzyme
MHLELARRFLMEPDKRLLFKFLWNFGWKGMRAVRGFRKRLRNGEFFPAFLFLSVTDRCNLSCQGCWVTPSNPPRDLDLETLDHIVSRSKEKGTFFFGILGGEPLLFGKLFDLFKRHPDAYFLLFTNGTLITEEIARDLRRAGNVSPLVSIEGVEEAGDIRRGGRHVYHQALRGLECCREQRLVTGVATSVCRSNFEDLVSERFVDELIRRGVHYLWYYIYRPVGPKPTPELALSPDLVRELRQFMVDIRTRSPILVVDAYWDQDGRALCPAAVGIGQHIGPGGDIEPCPPIQFACENILDSDDLYGLFNSSRFLKDFRTFVPETTRGCILMEHPALLGEFLKKHGAYDTSGRASGFEELARMTPHMSHHMPGAEIPEKSRVYRFAKKNWFFGFGAYG